jgi:hypothetical protein
MHVILAYCHADLDQAKRWRDWVAELGGVSAHHIHTLTQADNARLDFSVFASSTDVIDYEKETSEWSSGASNTGRSAAGPNSMFRQAAWHAHYTFRAPFLFIEPDCIPLAPDWLDRIETEYEACGKPFMGALVPRSAAGTPQHMSGNAVYPADVATRCTSIMLARHWAWDVAGAEQVVPMMHETKLIQHSFRHPGFTSQDQFVTDVSPEARVFHSCKDGSIIPFLRGERASIPMVKQRYERVDSPIPAPVFKTRSKSGKRIKAKRFYSPETLQRLRDNLAKARAKKAALAA